MKRFKSKLVLVIALILVISSVVLAESSFSDVKSDAWYYKSVTSLANRGGIAGYTDGTFKPNGTITFSEFLKMALSSATSKDYPAQAGGHWASGVHAEAINLGIIDGREFAGTKDVLNRPISREDMTLILVNINEKIQGEGKIDTSNTSGKISDINKVAKNRQTYVLQAYEKGLVSGKGGNTGFDPQGVTTRAEASAVIMRMLDKEFRVDPSAPVETPVGDNVFDLSNPNRSIRMKEGDTVILPSGEKVVLKMGRDYLGQGQGIHLYQNVIGANGKPIEVGATAISIRTEDFVSKEVIAKYKAAGAQLPKVLSGAYMKTRNGDYVMSELESIMHTAYFLDLPNVSEYKIGDRSPCDNYIVRPVDVGSERGSWIMDI